MYKKPEMQTYPLQSLHGGENIVKAHAWCDDWINHTAHWTNAYRAGWQAAWVAYV